MSCRSPRAQEPRRQRLRSRRGRELAWRTIAAEALPSVSSSCRRIGLSPRTVVGFWLIFGGEVESVLAVGILLILLQRSKPTARSHAIYKSLHGVTGHQGSLGRNSAELRVLPLEFVRLRAVSGETPAYLKAVRTRFQGRHRVRPNAAGFVRA
jgi:hypothetical protein